MDATEIESSLDQCIKAQVALHLLHPELPDNPTPNFSDKRRAIFLSWRRKPDSAGNILGYELDFLAPTTKVTVFRQIAEVTGLVKHLRASAITLGPR